MTEVESFMHRLRLIHDEILESEKRLEDCVLRARMDHITIKQSPLFSNEVYELLAKIERHIGINFCNSFKNNPQKESNT